MRIINKSQEKIQVKTAMPYSFVHEQSWVKFQAKSKDYKIDIGYNSDNIAVVKCKLRSVIGLFCVRMMSPWTTVDSVYQ
jgi:hypothetical protein